jgi:hypothetical protein
LDKIKKATWILEGAAFLTSGKDTGDFWQPIINVYNRTLSHWKYYSTILIMIPPMISAGDEAEFWNRGFCHFLRLLDMAAHAVSGINR